MVGFTGGLVVTPVSEGLPRLAAGSIRFYRCFASPRVLSTLPEALEDGSSEVASESSEV